MVYKDDMQVGFNTQNAMLTLPHPPSFVAGKILLCNDCYVARLKRGIYAEENLNQKKLIDAYYEKQAQERFLQEARSYASNSQNESDLQKYASALANANSTQAYANLSQYFLASLANSQKYPDVTFELMPRKQKGEKAADGASARSRHAADAKLHSRKRKVGPEGGDLVGQAGGKFSADNGTKHHHHPDKSSRVNAKDHRNGGDAAKVPPPAHQGSLRSVSKHAGLDLKTSMPHERSSRESQR